MKVRLSSVWFIESRNFYYIARVVIVSNIPLHSVFAAVATT